jgi:hypothetical protein
LSIAQLYAVAFIAGSLTMMFDLAYEAFVPGLIGRDQLADGRQARAQPRPVARRSDARVQSR